MFKKIYIPTLAYIRGTHLIKREFKLITVLLVHQNAFIC